MALSLDSKFKEKVQIEENIGKIINSEKKILLWYRPLDELKELTHKNYTGGMTDKGELLQFWVYNKATIDEINQSFEYLLKKKKENNKGIDDVQILLVSYFTGKNSISGVAYPIKEGVPTKMKDKK
ncbi:hypothetical protein KY366_07910 [Candidatus Woesearchaeota archaeon]|nr:hypothetical protein [Candidatus Woesearchaeota archaeon]